MELQGFILAVIIGTLFAIIYSLRVLVILEKRIANMEQHIQKLINKVLKEEYKIGKLTKKRRKH